MIERNFFIGVELTDGDRERLTIIRQLGDQSYPVVDMSDNEMAKLHIRHMVGGLAPDIANERLYRFEFPERPGALLKFLRAIAIKWNISLFHYRNHGSDYGRVLAGIQIPDSDRQSFEQHLNALGYPYWEESDNPAYQMFLAQPEGS